MRRPLHVSLTLGLLSTLVAVAIACGGAHGGRASARPLPTAGPTESAAPPLPTTSAASDDDDGPPGGAAPPPSMAGHVNQVLADGSFAAAVTPPAPAPPPPPPPAIKLPSLSALQVPATTPAVHYDAEHPCGLVMRDGEEVALECQEPGQTRVTDALEPEVSQADLGAAQTALPAVVDHRNDGTEGPVRNQGRVGACSAFSLSAAMDHAIIRRVHAASDVDVLQIWARYHTYYADLAIKANKGKHLSLEPIWPYDATTAETWLDPASNKSECARLLKKFNKKCGERPDPAKMALADSEPFGELGDVHAIPNPTNTGAFRPLLAAGQDIWILVRDKGFYDLVKQDGVTFVRDYDAHGQGGGHFIVIAGYRTSSDGTYFLIHNSWGAGWADGGYVYVHEETLKKNIDQAYLVDAFPAGTGATSSGGGRPRRLVGHTVCKRGTEPDSITLQCVPPCPDKSPRHNGACAVAGNCPAGQVNLSGECVLAAPASSRPMTKDALGYTCGPGGCFYQVPRGTMGCTQRRCEVSCPAPDYRLSRGASYFSCVE